jgi:hypothetical protein
MLHKLFVSILCNLLGARDANGEKGVVSYPSPHSLTECITDSFDYLVDVCFIL